MTTIPLIERAGRHAERIAVDDLVRTYTYGELVNAARLVACNLLGDDRDLQEARIAYMLPAGFEYIAAQWGIWQAGGIAVPLSLSATEKELEYTLTDAEVHCIITSENLLSKLAGLGHQLNIPLLAMDCLDTAAAGPLPEIDAQRAAMILYTSGTTSKPKGVVSTHACIQSQIETLIKAWAWNAEDRIPLFLPLHHIHGIINIMSCALWSGGRIETFHRFEIETVMRRVADHAYTVFMAVPTIYAKLIDRLSTLPDDRYDAIIDGFRQMRLMVSGSAALPASVHEKWTSLTGQKLLERYGMTEIGMALSNPYEGERRPGAVGQPLPGVEIRLRSEKGETVKAENESGEIQVRGPNVFREYWKRPEATAESFENGWFKTGDMAIIEDGYYRIMGRSSVDIIKSGGYKLSALEIESSLLDHPEIEECAVVGIPDDVWGEVVGAAIAWKGKEPLELESLRAWCENRISSYKIPRQVLQVDRLPRNAMGKVTKPAVTALFTGR